mgnify:CR=1 FL=1
MISPMNLKEASEYMRISERTAANWRDVEGWLVGVWPRRKNGTGRAQRYTQAACDTAIRRAKACGAYNSEGLLRGGQRARATGDAD